MLLGVITYSFLLFLASSVFCWALLTWLQLTKYARDIWNSENRHFILYIIRQPYIFFFFTLKILHSLSVTIIQSFYLPHTRMPSLLPVPSGLFCKCSDFLPLYKWTCVIHRLTKLNKKTDMSPQSLVAEVLEPKKNWWRRRRRGCRKQHLKNYP